MNKAIQYREDGKFYGLVNVPEYFLRPPNKRSVPGQKKWALLYDNLQACIAAGKEIINPEVVVKHEYTPEGIYYTHKDKVVKTGDIFDCPENIEFEEINAIAKSASESVYKLDGKVIRLKLKQEVNPVESQEQLWNDANWITHGCAYADGCFPNFEELKSKFTIQRNKNGNE